MEMNNAALSSYKQSSVQWTSVAGAHWRSLGYCDCGSWNSELVGIEVKHSKMRLSVAARTCEGCPGKKEGGGKACRPGRLDLHRTVGLAAKSSIAAPAAVRNTEKGRLQK